MYESPAWMEHAACRSYRCPRGDPWPWDTEPLRSKRQEIIRTARARVICRDCPVRPECLLYGIMLDHRYGCPEGIWGGTLPEERAALQGLSLVIRSGARHYAS